MPSSSVRPLWWSLAIVAMGVVLPLFQAMTALVSPSRLLPPTIELLPPRDQAAVLDLARDTADGNLGIVLMVVVAAATDSFAILKALTNILLVYFGVLWWYRLFELVTDGYYELVSWLLDVIMLVLLVYMAVHVNRRPRFDSLALLAEFESAAAEETTSFVSV